jgi:predicted esterase
MPAGAFILLTSTPLTAQRRPSLDFIVTTYLWSEDEALRQQAEAALNADDSLKAVSRIRFHDVEELIRRGRTDFPPPPAWAYGGFLPEEVIVTLPDGRTMPVIVQLPPQYNPATAWPMLLAMHGGPPGSAEGARRSANRMLRVWNQAAADAGWIIVSPIMTTVVSAGGRTEDRLPYEILRSEQMEAILATVEKRYRIDPNRIVSTGISLGSNFSIAFACARPDRFAAIVPVSTEGDSRELLLRNMMHVPAHILEGTQDRNIRTIQGPNALAAILTSFGYDLTYREFGDRAHEGFQEHYPDVLRWLADRPRPVYPREVLRVPHPAIAPTSRRVFWIETDTREGLAHAKVEGNRIDITTRWVREIRLYLHDRLVDLDRPVEVWANGVRVKETEVTRSVPLALEQARFLKDTGRIYAGSLTVTVPQSEESLEAGRSLWKSLEPKHPEGVLSFWEMYATRALEERFPTLGLEGQAVDDPTQLGLDGEMTGIRLTQVDPDGPFGEVSLRVGDVLLEVDGEPFVASHGLGFLHAWLLRELDGVARPYTLLIWRNGERLELESELALGDYREPEPVGQAVPGFPGFLGFLSLRLCVRFLVRV